jgi:hypothetical protein
MKKTRSQKSRDTVPLRIAAKIAYALDIPVAIGYALFALVLYFSLLLDIVVLFKPKGRRRNKRGPILRFKTLQVLNLI